LLTLLVSPLAKRWRQGQLIKLRPLGLWCAAWASLHFMVWLGLDLQFDWG
jgi:sulfoxide reductase heme-binding subunit YedZ